jgi:uncharacterized protein DUF4124
MTERVAALVTAAALVAASPASAEIHRWIDADGVINYSDRAPQAAVNHAAPPLPPAAEPPVAIATVAPAEPVAVATPAPAAAPVEVAPNGPVSLDDLFQLTGTRRQLAGLTARLAREFRPAQGQVAAPAQATIERIVARTFHADTVYRLAREEFARGLDRSKLEAKLRWLRSPLGRKVAALEIATADPEHDRELAEFAATVATAPPSARRRQLVERLDWVSGASDVSADVTAALSSSVTRAIALNTLASRRPSRRQIESQAEEVRAGAAVTLRQATLVSMLYTYRTLSDEELERYVEFESTEAGRWYNALLRRALLTTLTRAFDETAQAVFAAVPPDRWARATPTPR